MLDNVCCGIAAFDRGRKGLLADPRCLFAPTCDYANPLPSFWNLISATSEPDVCKYMVYVQENP